jgi:hypothetical protein
MWLQPKGGQNTAENTILPAIAFGYMNVPHRNASKGKGKDIPVTGHGGP